jgi:hypothetical protein
MMDQLEQLVKTCPDEKVSIYKNCSLIDLIHDTVDFDCLSVDGLSILSFQLLDREGNTPCQVYLDLSSFSRSDLDHTQVSR